MTWLLGAGLLALTVLFVASRPTVAQPLFQGSISLSPSSGPPGTVVTAYGTGWTPNSQSPPYEIHWDSKTGPILATFSTNPNGAFSTSFNIPTGASSGIHEVWACERCTGIVAPALWAYTTFKVTTPAPTPTDTPPPEPICWGDEAMSFDPPSPMVGQEVIISVTSSKAHTNVVLEGPFSPTFVEATSGGLGYIWRWRVTVGSPGWAEYRFYANYKVQCAIASVLVGEAPTPTPTFTPMATPTFTPTATPTPVITECDRTGAEGEVVIDFEDFALGETLNDVTVAGVATFVGDDELTVLDPVVETHSGSKALRISPGWLEFGSAGIAMRIRFESLQDFVGVFVGLEQAEGHEFTATLTAFGLDNEGHRIVVGTDTATLGPDAMPIMTCLAVEAPGQIFEITINYGLGFEVGQPEVIDDLIFRGPEVPVPVPEDDLAPVVDITQPVPPAMIYEHFVEVAGEIIEDRELDRVELWLNGDFSRELVAPGSPPTYLFRYPIPETDLIVYSPNTIEIWAFDAAGNMGSDTVDFDFWPRPTPTPVPALDIIAVGAEITQVIQCFGNRYCPDNSVPLYINKPTLVRLYVRAEGTSTEVPNISGEICRLVEGREEARNCRPSINRVTVPVTDDPVRDFRGDITRTLNFLLPTEWVTEPEESSYRIHVNRAGLDAAECCLANNKVGRAFRLNTGRELNVIAMRANVNGERIRPDQIGEGLTWLLRYYPTSDIDIYTHEWDPIRANWNFENQIAWVNLLARLDWIRFWTYEGFSRPRYHAFVPDWINLGDIGGLAWIGEYRAYARSSASVWSSRFGLGDNVGHELAHNHGFYHAPGFNTTTGTPGCGEAGASSGYPQYFAPDGTPYLRASIGEWGVDLWDPDPNKWLKDPALTQDLMSYCDPIWISLYTYELLGERIDSYGDLVPGRSWGLARPVAERVGEVLVGSGFIRADGIEFDPATFFRIPLPEDETLSPDEGRYTVQLRDGQGNVIYAQAFAPQAYSDNPDPEEGYFFLIIPWSEGTAEIAFLFQDITLGTIPVSVHPPTVTVLEPNGGESWPAEGTVTVRWEASDPDGDPLLALVQYSRDGGESWHLVAMDVKETSVELDGANLAGSSQAAIQVCVSDGVNTACDQSDGAFSVPPKGPEVFISSPEDGAVFPTGEQVILQGFAFDREDGAVEDGPAYVWTSDRDGQLGTGRSLWGLPLSAGRHTITMTVTDRDGNAASASVSITIAPEGVELPPEQPQAPALGIGPMIVIVSVFVGALSIVIVGLIVMAYLLGRSRSAR